MFVGNFVCLWFSHVCGSLMSGTGARWLPSGNARSLDHGEDGGEGEAAAGPDAVVVSGGGFAHFSPSIVRPLFAFRRRNKKREAGSLLILARCRRRHTE